MKILVTGFGPFPGVDANPTETLLAEASGNLGTLGAHDAQTAILRTAWDFVRNWVTDNLEDAPFDLVLHLGLAGESKRFRLETTGRNQVTHDAADQDGQVHRGEVILPAGPPTLSCPLPLHTFGERLGMLGLPVEVSDDAGGYLCNFLYTLSLDAMQRAGRSVGVVFLHVPWVSDRNPPPGKFGVPLRTHLAVLESLLVQMRAWRTNDCGR